MIANILANLKRDEKNNGYFEIMHGVIYSKSKGLHVIHGHEERKNGDEK